LNNDSRRLEEKKEEKEGTVIVLFGQFACEHHHYETREIGF